MQQRNKAIDIARGAAIIMVLLHHVNGNKSLWLSPFITGGWVGVDLFFALSGFLVSGLIFNELIQQGRVNIGRFFIRRTFKIYPSFFVFITISLLTETVLYHFFSGPAPTVNEHLKDLLFLHNYFGGRWITTWSLDVEEAFYLLLAAFFAVVLKLKGLTPKTVVGTYITLLVVGVIGRIEANANNALFDFIKQFGQTHLRLDALFFGVLLSYFYSFHKLRLSSWLIKHQYVILSACFLAILPNFLYERNANRWISIVMLSTNPIAFGLAMLIGIENSASTTKKLNWVRTIGINSYAIYLWHPFVNLYSERALMPYLSQKRYAAYLATYLLLSLVIGLMFTKLIETPFLKIRDKLYPKQINDFIR